MLRDDLRRIAGREKVPLGTIEKDYLTSVLLAVLAARSDFGNLVFKGGTCIKKIYSPDARFSVDLDFSCQQETYSGILESLKQSFYAREMHGVQFLGVAEEEKSDSGARVSVRYQETSGHPTSIKLDLSFREKPLVKPEHKEILNPYKYALPACKVLALTLEEILAEKIRAVIARGAPRDVYDVWFLLNRKVKIDRELVAQKLTILKRDKMFDRDVFMERLEEKREEWARDLSPLLGAVPEFDQVRESIARFMKRP